MEKRQIIEALNKWNPWEKPIAVGIKRPEYIKQVFSFMDQKEIIVLKGIRRSGKSTILKQLINHLLEHKTSKKQILYLNLDDYYFAQNLSISLLEEVYNAYKEHTKNNKKTYFFIDEIQKIKGWEQWVRTKYDLGENIKFIISGSSASLLSKELSTLLTGRNISFKILPLSFKEYLAFIKKGSLEDYLAFGGFPEVVLKPSEEQKTELLRQYFEDIILKDIVDRYQIRNAKQLLDLAIYLISTSGSKVSFNKLAKVFGVSDTTIRVYINYMADAFLLFEVTYFSYSAKIKHDVTKLPKYYTIDPGLIRAISINHSKNNGQMFENAVFLKLLKEHREISYWSELKSEVDFIVDRKAINVTATDDVPNREIIGLEDFKNKHKEFSTTLITKSKTKDQMIALKEFLLF